MGQRFGAAILGCEGPRLTEAEKRFFSTANPFGFIMFLRNCETAAQITALCAELRDSVGWHAPVFIDQEGGRVQRLRPPLARDWVPPLDEVARSGVKAEAVMQLRYRIIAAELLKLGIDGNCAPLLDVARRETHAVLRNRCYGSDPDGVLRMGKAVYDGLVAGGVLPVIKHIPGHGRATLDSHLDLPRVSASRAELEADFAPFRAFADAPLGMSAHLVFEQIDPRPATTSPVIIDLIRRDLRFGGLLMTDDISMEALDGTVAERGAAALAAGCDVVLHCNGRLNEMQSLLDTVGQMSDPAQQRAEAALRARPQAPTVDIASLEAEFEALGLDPQI